MIEGARVYVALYVDDGFFLGRNVKVLHELVQAFKAEFIIVTSEFVNFVGMENAHDSGTIFVSQTKYIDKVLARFGMTEYDIVKTPADPNVKLVRPKTKSSLNVLNRRGVGSLLFLAIFSNPILPTRSVSLAVSWITTI